MESFTVSRTVIDVKSRKIGYGEPIFLTAEVGCSHLGSVENAKRLLEAAAEGGADGVDTFIWHVPGYYWNAPPGSELQQELDGLCLTPKEWASLHALADELDIVLYHTPLDPVSAQLAVDLGAPMLNINSDDLQNPIMLQQIGKTGLPVTFHDINAGLGEVEAAVTRLQEYGAQGPIALHSTLESGDTDEAYTSANLNVVKTYKAAFDARGALVGCVEHTTSRHLIYAVAALEPVLISKHLNLDEDPDTPDAAIAADVTGLKDMVHKVRQVEQALGEGVNSIVVNSEGKMPQGAYARRKVIVADQDIPRGTVIGPEHLAVKRACVPGALHPWMLHYLIGATASEDIAENTVVGFDMFEGYPQVDWRPQDILHRRYGGAQALV